MIAASQPTAQPGVRRSRWIPMAFFAFFGVIIAVNGVMLFFALDTFNGLTEEAAYEDGLRYDETIADYEAQRALGWHMNMAFEPTGPLAGELTVDAVDREGHGLVGATIQATLLRPTQEGFDQQAALAEFPAGHYSASIAVPLPGQWTVRLDISRDDDTFRLEQRLTIR